MVVHCTGYIRPSQRSPSLSVLNPFSKNIAGSDRSSSRTLLHLVDTIVPLPLLDIEGRILRTLIQALVVTRLGLDFPAHKWSELHPLSAQFLLVPFPVENPP